MTLSITQRRSTMEKVLNVLKSKDIEQPRDFRESDEWNQYRLENTDDSCYRCGEDDVLHLHHTTVPPDIEKISWKIAENLYVKSGRANEYIKRPSERCRGCACLHCNHSCNSGIGLEPRVAIKKLSVNTLFCQSFDDELAQDFDNFVKNNTDLIVESVLHDWNNYLENYKSNEDLITLCGKCHYLGHRYGCLTCNKCENVTPKTSTPSPQRYICGVCLGTHNQESWQSEIENLLNNNVYEMMVKDESGTYDTVYRWDLTYDDIWQNMANNSEFF